MNVNVTKIQRLSNGIIQFYNGSDIVDSFSVTSSVSIGFESNLAKTIIFSSSVKTLSFNVFNIIALYGSTSNKIYSAGIDPSDTSSAYVNRLYDIYGFLISDVIQGCCPGPTFVGGVVASYPNFASFPATGQQSVIYIDESTNQAYYWDGTSYQLLTSTGVETYPNFASFPVTGMANIIYVDLSVPESYVWNGSVYVSLDGGSVAWGSIIGTLSAQTDLQTALNAKQATLVSGTNIKTVNSTSLLGSGNLAVGTVTSVGLTMPSAFSVANSPITSSGDIAVTGAGTVSQYVRGDGSLANFPSSTGGGSSVAFYLNGSVAQGTFGGVAMKEMDRVPVLGAGTDFTIAANGYIQSFITDANVPNQLEIPAGNWNFETYFSASSGGGTPSFYVELYKWNGTTLSLIASNSTSPEGITNGTTIDAYFSALAVPQTTLLATDRLAIRIYVTHSGRTITLHTENSHLCQVITTFSTGLTALNGLTAQVQNFATGTSGTDFGISSATSTHTFNLPTASATNRGALSSADWTTFNSKVPSTRTLTINGTTQDLSADRTFTISSTNIYNTDGSLTGARTLTLNSNPLTIAGTSSSRFYANGNVGIGTTTDAGFKLDVNGFVIFRLGLVSPIEIFCPTYKSTGTTVGTKFDIMPVGQFIGTSGAITLLNVEHSDQGGFAPTSGTATHTMLRLGSLINQTGGANGITRGLYVNPTLTAAADFRAIETVVGGAYINTTSVAASAILQADSTTQGFLPPRVTTTQKNAITSPASGLVVYDSTLNALNFYNGSSWTSGSSGGTVTSVAALTLGTTGTDLSSTVATGTTTPVITLNVPDASATNRGALTATDWATFNNKQNALGFTAVPTTRTISTTAPLSGGGDLSADRTLSIAQATSSINGYLSSTDWNTFNNKQNTLSLTTTGTSGPATLVGATLNIPQYGGGGGVSAGDAIAYAIALG